MSGPIDALRRFYDHTLRPVQEEVARTAEQVARTAGEVGGAVAEVGRAVVEEGAKVAQAVAEEGVVDVAVGLARHEAAQGARILGELQRRSPAEFVDWLAGPEGPSVADTTAQIPGLQNAIGNVLDRSMGNPLVAGAVGRAFGFEYVPHQPREPARGDFYTTNEGSLQSYFGFHDAYDKVGKLLGMDLDDKVMEFEVNGVQYRLELWKGSYGQGGAFGGEIGLYTRGTGERGALGDLLEQIPGYYSSAAGASQIKMTQEIYNKETGQTYFVNDGKGADDGKHYWNLAIRTDPGVEHEDLGQRGRLETDDPALAKAICQALNQQGIPAELSPDGRSVSYTWE